MSNTEAKVPDYPLLPAEQIHDEPTLWPTLKQEVLGKGAIVTFVNDQVQTPDGSLMQRQYGLHPGAIAIVAWNDHDQIAVIKQYRHPVAYRLVEIPAGLMDHVAEDPLAAAQRELMEEVGLSADTWQTLTDSFSSPGAHEESLRVFLATDLHAVPRPENLEPEEADMSVFWVNRSDLIDAIFAGEVQSPTLIYGVLALDVAITSGRLASLRAANTPWAARQVWAKRHS